MRKKWKRHPKDHKQLNLIEVEEKEAEVVVVDSVETEVELPSNRERNKFPLRKIRQMKLLPSQKVLH